ncbi:VOC family protein [Roseomonas sp. E05]|uniref:VOC family protein n=1 Tax=Roseomonas sp. E05 TaxID=3046310 RepID=UPI0024BADCAC|nr:VOC family protein [Roseomonas sp. E05]MDJ0391289.1 VOC family protein [Roseomonas sp. E05]
MSAAIQHPEAAFDLGAAPMRIGRVRLRVRDLATVSGFYQDVLGLVPVEQSIGRLALGLPGVPLLELTGDPSLAPLDRRQAGLFHTAFLLPDRASLGRWLGFVAQRRISLLGASDHGVSEAIYLADPEGNGIEVYADRPVATWRSAGGQLAMPSEPLDLQDLLGAGDGAWMGMPAGTVIGHVHLQVGDTAAAERYYRDILGFEVTCRYPGGSFFGAGGYHHQLAANTWNSRRAGSRPERMVGLDSVEIVVPDAAVRDAIEERARAAGLRAEPDTNRGTMLHDPWGTSITLVSG